MAPFSADLSELEALYFSHAEDLFALCYLHTARGGEAFSLMRTALCDMAYSPKQWKLAQSGREGFLRAAHTSCMDYYVKNPHGPKKKRKKKEPEAPMLSAGAALPFSLTDSLRRILRLPVKFKTPLFLRLGRGWTAEETARAAGGSPARVDKLVETALKKLGMDREKVRTLLCSLTAGEDTLQRVWDRFLTDRDDQGFEGKQRLRRFKRWLDNAIPYIALGVVALGAFAFFGVEYGWFTGVPYEKTRPIDGYMASGYYGNSPAPASRIEYETGDLSVYAPEEDGFVQYVVAGAPRSASAAAKQMVALGGLPEGTSLLSVDSAFQTGEGGTAPGGEPGSPDAVNGQVSLTLEFSQEAADYFASASPEDAAAMLHAMTRTYAELYGTLESLRFQSGGNDLTAGGRTAQDFLQEPLAAGRSVETEYRG